MDSNILVVCIGNICRSPMAEGLLRDKFNQDGRKYQVSSAGLAALVNHPADVLSQELMLNQGIDISAHKARQISQDLVFNADIIFTMDQDQTQAVHGLYPAVKGRVFRIGHWGGFDVLDPYKRPKAIFEQSLALITQGINEWATKL